MKEKDAKYPRLGALSYENNLSSTDREPFSKQDKRIFRQGRRGAVCDHSRGDRLDWGSGRSVCGVNPLWRR